MQNFRNLSFCEIIDCKDTLIGVDFTECVNLHSIGQYAFYKCSKLCDIDLTSCVHLNSIGNSAFSTCTKLEQVLLPNFTMTELSNYLFSYCFSLSQIIIPSNIRYLRFGSFISCSNLQKITFLDDSCLENVELHCRKILNQLVDLHLEMFRHFEEFIFTMKINISKAKMVYCTQQMMDWHSFLINISIIRQKHSQYRKELNLLNENLLCIYQL